MATRNPPEIFEAIRKALASRGWVGKASSSGIDFVLEEPAKQGAVQIRLHFDTKRMWIPPSAFLKVLKGNPADFPWHRYGSWFCYLSSDSVEWDPQSQLFESHVVWAAERAVSEFHRLQKGEQIRQEDSEFAVHWAGDSAYMDIGDAGWPPALGTRMERLEVTRPEVPGAQPLKVYRLSARVGIDRYAAYEKSRTVSLVPTVYADLDRYPYRLPDGWPPENASQLNQWLQAHRPAAGKRLWKDIATAMFMDGPSASNVYVVLNTKAGRFGALLDVGGERTDGFRAGAPLAETLRGQNALTARIKVHRTKFERLDDDFVLKRNAPDNNAPLAAKRIHLVGVGAVGSSLADRLVQAGAGSTGGSLHLYDFDQMRPENLGRHLLGVPYLGLNKAEAVASYLRRNRLARDVLGHATAGTDPQIHRNADLVIDATSAPNVGAALSNAVRVERRWSLMFAFVEGEGWVAGCYLYRNKPGDACRTCWEPWIGGKGSHIRTEHAPETRDNGCGGTFTPYRAAAADMAAALASELACDWGLDKVTNRYRSVRLPNAPSHVRDGYNASPISAPGCMCSKPSTTSD